MGFCPPCQIKQWAFVQWDIVQWAFVLVGFCPSGLLSQWAFVRSLEVLADIIRLFADCKGGTSWMPN